MVLSRVPVYTCSWIHKYLCKGVFVFCGYELPVCLTSTVVHLYQSEFPWSPSPQMSWNIWSLLDNVYKSFEKNIWIQSRLIARDNQDETCLIITINDTSIGDLPLIITSSDTCKNQSKRLDSDNTINLSSLIVSLVENHTLKSRELRVNIPRRTVASGRTGPLTAPSRCPLVILPHIDRFQN
jgi:hypothetical protein